MKDLKEYFEDLYIIDTQEQVAVHMCVFVWIQRGNYFGGKPIERAEVEVRVGKSKNGKAAGEDEITGEMIKSGCDTVVDCIWRLCIMAFECGVMPEDWRALVIFPLYKSKGERTECKNCRSISLDVVQKNLCRDLSR